MGHFIARCDRDTTDAPTILAFGTRTPLDLALEGACWSRILTEYVTSGLLAASFSDVPSFYLALAGAPFLLGSDSCTSMSGLLPLRAARVSSL